VPHLAAPAYPRSTIPIRLVKLPPARVHDDGAGPAGDPQVGGRHAQAAIDAAPSTRCPCDDDGCSSGEGTCWRGCSGRSARRGKACGRGSGRRRTSGPGVCRRQAHRGDRAASARPLRASGPPRDPRSADRGSGRARPHLRALHPRRGTTCDVRRNDGSGRAPVSGCRAGEGLGACALCFTVSGARHDDPCPARPDAGSVARRATTSRLGASTAGAGRGRARAPRARRRPIERGPCRRRRRSPRRSRGGRAGRASAA
jgi:hypothetical protein